MIYNILIEGAVPNVNPMLGYALFFVGIIAVAGVIKWITSSMEKPTR